MPDYYLIPEVSDPPEEIVYDPKKYKMPEPCNLILPSIHESRDDIYLLTGADSEEAVTNLLASCPRAQAWPSSVYSSKEEAFDPTETAHDVTAGHSYGNDTPCETVETAPPPSECVRLPPNYAHHAKYKTPIWVYEAVDPQVKDAARALFFERKRQQLIWNTPSGQPIRLPNEYELFAAWVGLPRSEKMAYIIEITGNQSASSAVQNSTIEIQRAVSDLYNSCSNSLAWPSFQFIRIQQQQCIQNSPSFWGPRPFPQSYHSAFPLNRLH